MTATTCPFALILVQIQTRQLPDDSRLGAVDAQLEHRVRSARQRRVALQVDLRNLAVQIALAVQRISSTTSSTDKAIRSGVDADKPGEMRMRRSYRRFDSL